MVQLVNNNPKDTNYHSTSEIFTQLLQGQKDLTLNTNNVQANATDANIFNYGWGMLQLNGFARISAGSPTANLEIGSLPLPINPTRFYNFPVCVLRAGSGVVNFISVTPRGSSVSSITVVAAGTYTAIPTASIVGRGFGAVLGAPRMKAVSATITGGGTGYVVGNVLTLSGGTSTTAATLTVSSVSGGIITGVTITNPGSYSALPANPVNVTGGAGTGANFTVNWGVLSIPVTTGGYAYDNTTIVQFSTGAATATAVLSAEQAAKVVLGNAPNTNDIVCLDSPSFLVETFSSL